jgi:hypothetical protein
VISEKQLVLRPQDLVVAIKLATNRHREFTLSGLADELGMALSAVHGSVKRCELARLVSRSGGSIRALRPAVKEFVLHGAKYAFPAVLGAIGRGTPTSVGAPVLSQHFDQGKVLPPVWPDPHGAAFGSTVIPLHDTVPAAARKDQAFYDVMALLDAIRLGAARERELAVAALEEKLS